MRSFIEFIDMALDIRYIILVWYAIKQLFQYKRFIYSYKYIFIRCENFRVSLQKLIVIKNKKQRQRTRARALRVQDSFVYKLVKQVNKAQSGIYLILHHVAMMILFNAKWQIVTYLFINWIFWTKQHAYLV